MRFLARLASHTRSLHHRPSRQCFSTSLLRANAEPSEPAQTSPAVDDADVVGSMEDDDMLLKELNKELDNVSTNESTEPIYDLERTVEDFKHDDITSIGHLMLRNQRQLLKYLRLIEMEVPLLSAFRKPFHPPPMSQSPITIRTLSYGGEPHPATRKAVLVAPVSHLPLKSPAAIHKFKLLAGPRWTTDAPRDAGLSTEEVRELSVKKGKGRAKDGEGDRHGFIKISHEGLPVTSMNAKWCSDTLDKLIEEANKDSDSFAGIALSHRHIEARIIRQRRGDHRVSPGPKSWKKTTIMDIPRRWL